MTYNMSAVAASDNIAELLIGVNTASGNILAPMILIVIWFILLIALILSKNPAPESMLSSSLVCTVISLFLLAMNLLDITWVIGFGILTAITAVGIYAQK